MISEILLCKSRSIIYWIWRSDMLLFTNKEINRVTFTIVLFSHIPKKKKKISSTSQATSINKFHSNLQMHRHIIGLTDICEATCNSNSTKIITRFSKIT